VEAENESESVVRQVAEKREEDLEEQLLAA